MSRASVWIRNICNFCSFRYPRVPLLAVPLLLGSSPLSLSLSLSIPLLFTLSLSEARADENAIHADVFIISDEGLETIPSNHLEFLEGYNHTVSLQTLSVADWTKTLIADQSLVDGYWVRFRVENKISTDEIGIEHNYNSEKKLFTVNSNGVTEYPYWKQREGDWIGDGRLLAHHRVIMPAGEITTIYNYFRNKPFDRFMSKVNGLDRMTIGPWKDIHSLQLLGLVANVAIIAISLAFGLYYLFMFLVSRGNYLWLSASLFQIAFASSTSLSIGWVMKLPGWLVNSEFTLASLSLMFLFLTRFFQNSLNLKQTFPRIHKLFQAALFFFASMVVLNLYLTLGWPNDANLDLVAYPPDRSGPGIVKIDSIMIPFVLLLLSSAILSFVLWRRGSTYAKFLLVSFSLPFLAVPISGFAYLVFDFSWVFWFVVSTAVGILFLAMFVTFGFAVAQQLNDMKALALAQQVRVTEAYQRFVPSQLLQNLGRDSILDVQLGDQVDVEMSIVFSDIRSFTSISETMSPSENFAFVNAYLSRMGPIIRARRGYIDKFMGDGVMALFPLSANDAVLAAVEMQRELYRYNEEQDRAGAPRINVGVGINTGRMMLGTLGEADRMEGSVISDAVNLASRLEGLTKRYASKVIISEQTYRHLDTGKFDCRLIDSVVVKGKDRPVRIFEVIDGEPPEVARLKRSSLAQFSEAMSLYKGQKFAEARDLFKAVLSESENDNVARLYVERCEKLLEGGWNPETWDGVERLETK